jgi:hypothetical protein
MAFLRFTRDKRGYEHFQLVQPPANPRDTSQARILYWFRSPPNVRVGREPFDQNVRSALEKQNPDVEFDWQRILATSIPSEDAERWRERRRRAREARQFAEEEASLEPLEGEVAPKVGEDSSDRSREPVKAEASPSSGENSEPGREHNRRRRRRRRGRHRRPDASGVSGSESEGAGPAPGKPPDPQSS